ncbi:sigma-70 family RNA polymerase sigma factor [Bacillus hwajinpoensis]|uniref:Sigma-70 family RNA polymerase sigma factor n=1 Tax=Guptibacillus hwajinpoensis TaxID=208199 RepID=A0A845EQ03_9BACL|nr:RNA polymerase sigma factor [Pseudalkalibacillus hwajinpoensis]MYL61784.1 sigma-70 family RNA polymerase sigma factor [Pseudalkalibacillus hwajinpoensis]
MTDEELVLAMTRGNQAAFEAFVHRYHGPLLGYLERMLRDRKKAEDVVQDTFLKLIKQLKSNKIPEKIKPWLYQVATNQCRDYWKSAGFKSEKQILDYIPDQPDKEPSVVELFERQESRVEFLKKLDTLSETQREIVYLRFYQELKYQEIAETLELPLGTVKSNLFHALKKLKASLARKEEVNHAKY